MNEACSILNVIRSLYITSLYSPIRLDNYNLEVIFQHRQAIIGITAFQQNKITEK